MIIIIDILHGLPDLGFSGFLPPVWNANFYPSPFRGNEFGLPKCKIGNCFHIFSIDQDGICSFYKGLLVTVIRISSEFCHFHATVNQNRKISSAGAFPQIFGPYNISENITYSYYDVCGDEIDGDVIIVLSNCTRLTIKVNRKHPILGSCNPYNPWTNRLKISHGWLRRRSETTC